MPGFTIPICSKTCYTQKAVEPPAEKRWTPWKKFSPHFLSLL